LNTAMLKKQLRVWFILDLVADFLTALPLMIIPVAFLKLLGWSVVDPVASRICAAALFGIGIESFLGRNSDIKTFIAMLNLKIIWSMTAIVGFIINLMNHTHGNPPALWAFLIIFILFHALWLYYRIKLHSVQDEITQ
jgi:hypothetical protein